MHWLHLQPVTLSVVSEFLRQYGYWILFVGTLLEGEVIVIVAGALAHAGVLDLSMVILVSWLGSTINDQVLYLLGYRYGKRILDWLPLFLRRHIVQAEGLIRRFGDWVTLLFRFIYGSRTITPILLGVHRYPAKRYIWVNPVAAALWAGTIAGIGYVLGASLNSLLAQVQHVQIVLLVLVMVGGGIYWFWQHHKKRHQSD